MAVAQLSKYKLIGDHASGKATARLGANKLRFLWYSLLAAFLLLAALAVGRYQASPVVLLATRPSVFEYNSTFQDERSPLTDDLWEGLFPKRKGFFQHPTIADQRSAFAVYHQLHCLNSIRQGYWALYDMAASRGQNNRTSNDNNLPHMLSPHHIRHCLELLRLALMCQPDLTVEPKNETLGGVTGFGTEHQCKSWEDLSQWMAQWESFGL